tara:strand:- start:1492 stop:1674 length:183 start_codon:yes stop_codon:yes gene_type:complete
MSEEKTISHTVYQQILTLISQLIETSIWQDAKLKSKDPVKNPGESFMTNKLKLIKETLEK